MRLPIQPASWIPDWARRAVFYHIYPLGFFGAPSHNDHTEDRHYRLARLRDWYDHLRQLGVTAIYFGPLFESSSHGYDTADYFVIDRRLGGNELFQQIVGELHDRGIRLILDGVFNHTGRDFFAFRDILQNGRDSRYVDWYRINWAGNNRYQDGFTYEAWEGHQSLPKLNIENPEVRNYILEVARMWLGDMGADGWRLDVAYEIDPSFWWEFRRACDEARPDSFLVGELLHGDLRKWVAPDLLHAATNYQLYKPIWSSLNSANFWELKANLDRAFHSEWGLYRNIGMMNFLGNHDVTRILSQLEDARHIYPAMLLLMTLPGIPCLYYGDETGMTGRKEDGDGALRQPMPGAGETWPDPDRYIFEALKRLSAVRNAHPSLVYGTYSSLEAGPTVLGFLRQHSMEVAVVVVNSGKEPASLRVAVGREGIQDGTVFRDALNPDDQRFAVHSGSLQVESIYPGWGRVLIANGG
nr:alpha-amylase [Anaerolineae bacterium]